jgi:uncharacterized protein
MKKALLPFLLLLSVALTTFAQTNSTERFIEVAGEGEVKVDPDILYLSIELREYKKDGKIIRLEELEGQLRKVLQTLEVPETNLKVFASSGRQYGYKIKRADLLLTKKYTLKLTDVGQLDPLLSELAFLEIYNVFVSEVTHSEIEKYKTEAKVKAIDDAKAKAMLLTTSLGCKLGQALQIRETEFSNAYPLQSYQGRAANFYGLSYEGAVHRGVSYEKEEKSQVGFEQIKLTYRIAVKFRLD